MSKKKALLLALVLVLGFQTYRTIVDSGFLFSIEPTPYGSCEKLHGPPGSEDIKVDAINRVAFISSGNGREVLRRNKSGNTERADNGDIWLLDLSVPDSQPYRLNVDPGSPFYPHGIDLLYLPDGQRELYVVNHPGQDKHEVMIFSIATDHSLSLKRPPISYPELVSPNDIKAISDDQFFATNDLGSPQTSVMANIERYLGLSRSSVSYFDGEQGSFLLKGIKSANGITLSADQETLYVGEAIGRSVLRYKRGETLRDWEFFDKSPMGTAVDNLEWSDDGKLLAGAHPKLFDFVRHARNPDHNSPSHVISIDLHSSPMKPHTLYLQDGEELSGSSVATMLNGEMLIGSVFEDHFLRCNKD
ncbi:MAG: hypothetical protein AAF431_09815 [Pseudomonadota bacterium]